MSHRTAKHEKSYRKGKVALIQAAAKKEAAATAAADFLAGKYKSVTEAAREHNVDHMAVHRRIWYAPQFPLSPKV